MSEFLIRRAKLEDAMAIAELHFAGWKRAYGEFIRPELLAAKSPDRRLPSWRAWIEDRERTTLVGVDPALSVQGFVIGGPVLDHEFTSGSLQEFDCELYILHCHAEIEGRGLGRALIAALARAFMAQGRRALSLWAYRDNAFRNFYDRLGGRIVAEGLDEGDPDVAYGWDDLGQLIARCEEPTRQSRQKKDGE